MQRKKVANRAEVDARTAQVARFLEREDRWDLGVERLDGLGTALIAIYEAGVEDPIKTDLLDQFVSIIRRKGRPDERAREIAELMRGWQQMRRD